MNSSEEPTLTQKSREVVNNVAWHRFDCSCGGIVTITYSVAWIGFNFIAAGFCSVGNHSFQIETGNIDLV